MLGKSSDVCQLGTEDERILTSFTQRLIEIAAVAGARGTGRVRHRRAKYDALARALSHCQIEHVNNCGVTQA
jgi:hypothetical protein